MDLTSAAARRLRGMPDPRSNLGIFSRGKNIYRGTSHAANFKGYNRPVGIGGPTPTAHQLHKQHLQHLAGLAKAQPNDPNFRAWLVRHGVFKNVPKLPARVPWTSLPFSHDYSQGMQDIKTALADIASQYQLGSQRAGEDIDLSRRDLSQKLGEGDTALENKFGDTGLLHSSINIGEQGKLYQQYQQALEEANRGYGRNIEDLAQARQQAQQALNSQQSNLEYQRTQYMSDLAKQQAQQQGQAYGQQQQVLDQDIRQYDPNKLQNWYQNYTAGLKK